MVAYPNPDSIEIHFEQLEAVDSPQLGDLWEAARAAGVKPGTIHVWVSRKKIEPVLVSETGPLFHLPTIRRAAAGGAKHRPTNPAANSRGPHTRAA